MPLISERRRGCTSWIRVDFGQRNGDLSKDRIAVRNVGCFYTPQVHVPRAYEVQEGRWKQINHVYAPNA